MWKPGQLVTLWGKVYRIQKCSHTVKYRACYFCAATDKLAPCMNKYNYPLRNGFSMQDCMKKMPVGCYPKLLNSK